MTSPYSDSLSRSLPTDPRARAKRGTLSPVSRSATSSPLPHQTPERRALSPLSKKIQELKAIKGAGHSSGLGILQEKQRSQIHLLLEGVDTTHLPQFSKRLGKSEEREMVDRISQRKRKVPKLLQQAELARLEQSERKQDKLFQEFKNKRVDQDEVAGFLQRMNDKEERRRNKLKELQEPKEQPPVVLSADQLADFTERMHNSEMERRQEAQEELLTAAYPEEEEPRTIGGEELEESLNRIYHDPMAASLDRRKRLEEKYVFQRKTAKRLDDGAIRELADKLSKPKSKEVSASNPYFGATHLS